jgi:hypothetical protein
MLETSQPLQSPRILGHVCGRSLIEEIEEVSMEALSAAENTET